MSTGKGKIARLPFDVRQQLNVRMRDGVPDPVILSWLNDLPEVKKALAAAEFGGPKQAGSRVTPQNLSEYRRAGGPYEAWVAKQEEVESIRALTELSYQMALAAGGDVHDPAVAVTAGKIASRLEGATGEQLVAYADALARLNKSTADKLKARTDRSRLDVQRDALALDERKFQRSTAEMFVKWYADKRAQEIADGKEAKEVKMDKLIQLMFGERPQRA
jgi:hypothetical protein